VCSMDLAPVIWGSGGKRGASASGRERKARAAHDHACDAFTPRRFKNGTWDIDAHEPSTVSLKKQCVIDAIFQENTPLYSVLTRLVMRYSYGHVSMGLWIPRAWVSSNSRRRLRFCPPARITPLDISWPLAQQDQVTGLFSHQGRDLFGATVDGDAYPSPLIIETLEIDAWLTTSGITGAVAFVWFATMGAWLDVGCAPERRRRMDMVPVWIHNDAWTMRCILEFLPSSSVSSYQSTLDTFTTDPFELYRAGASPAFSWACDWNTHSTAPETMQHLFELVNGHVRHMPRLHKQALVDVPVDARGIIYTRLNRWSVASSSNLASRCLVFPLIARSEGPREHVNTANLVRKAIVCWRALLYQLEERNTCMSHALKDMVVAEFFQVQRSQLFEASSAN
jgi:hypothetical protein